MTRLRLREQVIIVGNVADQVKFSELTLDMFRMLQTLEREPQDEMNQVCAITTSRAAKVYNNKVPLKTFLCRSMIRVQRQEGCR